MSPYLFAQAVSVPLGLTERAVNAAERVLVDCLELEAAAQEHHISPAVVRQAITVIFRQCYRIIALHLPQEADCARIPAVSAGASPRCAYAC